MRPEAAAEAEDKAQSAQSEGVAAEPAESTTAGAAAAEDSSQWSVVHISNLKRPYTLGALKDMLAQVCVCVCAGLLWTMF